MLEWVGFQSLGAWSSKRENIMKQFFRSRFVVVPVLALLSGVRIAFCQEKKIPPEKSFIDYFLPMPVNGDLSKEAWGAAEVGARDQKNGLEDPNMSHWNYWDGQIIKGHHGKYHMFASRWDQAKGHRGWGGSKAVHAVSDNAAGPYIDKGLCWPNDQGGKGHNVTALVLPNGRYAVVISETRPGTVFASKSLDGPWEQLGTIKGEGTSGVQHQHHGAARWRLHDCTAFRPGLHQQGGRRHPGAVQVDRGRPPSPRASPISKTRLSFIPAASITSSSTHGARGRPTT